MFARTKKALVGGAALVVSGASFATEPTPAIDVTEAVSTINSGMDAVTAIGAAGLVIVAAIAIYRMIRRAP